MNLIVLKGGVVTCGETKPIHSQLIREREWMLGDCCRRTIRIQKSYADL